jgi:hypothetical protein
MMEKVTITAVVAPLQLSVDEVPEGSYHLPGNDMKHVHLILHVFV